MASSFSLVGSPRISQGRIPEMAECFPNKTGTNITGKTGPEKTVGISALRSGGPGLYGPEINALVGGASTSEEHGIDFG